MAAAKALAAALASLLARPAGADLPIHCTLADAVGEWTFHVGPAQPVNGELPACGHSLPNSVESMLRINHSSVVPPSAAETLSITLTEEIAEQPERHLRARDGSGAEGMWTMVYDTGFEVRVGGRSLSGGVYDYAALCPSN
ncbi:unnamed protein product [Prorocentrum cordatum]|uniref:Cathepsin C exclusion domain-containing protein n=1 Tax=Prorocentrum cordatum TaxID=2364126 RepID=A0ABN9QK52_9DINO|nr:unnamed protein product [Polarella glacialis]CAK0839399.1 unnamed protein product [Polarella glacialis]